MKLQSKHDEFNLHKRLKEVAGIYRRKNHFRLVNENNELATNAQEKELIWKRYIDNLFSDDRPNIEMEINNNELSGPPITKEEIIKAFQNSKANKAAGSDKVPVELLKLLEKEGLTILQKIFNKTYWHIPHTMAYIMLYTIAKEE